MKNLADAGIQIVIAGARRYLSMNNKTANSDALAACCKSWLKIALPEALSDAKDAMNCGMTEVGIETFKATLFNAGIEAAKECSL